MPDSTVLLRCPACKTVNKVPAHKLNEMPRCGKCKVLLEFPRKPVEGTAANFAQEVLRWPGATLVEFWSPGCGVCRSVAPIIGELARQRAGHLKIVTINTEHEWSLSTQFNIRAVPAFMLYKNGVKINEINGGLPKAQLEAWVDSSLRG
jgi:thioredoxin 2